MSIRKRTWRAEKATEEKSVWIVDYRHNGKRHIKSFGKKAEAVAWDAQTKQEKRHGLHTANSKLTVAALLEMWIADCRAEGLERSTIEQRGQYARDHINPHIGSVRVSQLTTPMVNSLADKLRDGTELAPATCKKVIVTLGTALAFAQDRGLIAQNVAAARSKKRRSNDRHTAAKLKAGVDFPTKPELKALIDTAPSRWRPFIVTAIFSGLRASELRGLRWEDVDLDAGLIHVRQRADAWGTIGSPKSKAGTRDVPLVPLAVNALRQWRVQSAPGRELVFCTRSGKPYALTNVRKKVWVPLLQQNEMRTYGFHSLRHAAASLFIELGWSAKRIQDVLGHSSITMTFDRYGHLFPQHDLAGDMAKLQAAIGAV
jgi:integrase